MAPPMIHQFSSLKCMAQLWLRPCLVALSMVVGVAAAQNEAPRVEDVLKVAGTYVGVYEKTLAFVAEEEYTQQVALDHRTLHSDILFIRDELFGWLEFRDVARRDGIPVRDREERLLALFTKPNPDRVKQAQRVVAEGARFNLNPPGKRVNRTINLPLTAVRFLRTADQYRSSFRIAGFNPRTRVVALEFTERHQPRLIETTDDAAATGRFDIETATGRVISSRLTLQTGETVAVIRVQFGADAHLGVDLPQTMYEEYRGAFVGLVTGMARYSRYRQFQVETEERIKQ
jgi:hypothetical protein